MSDTKTLNYKHSHMSTKQKEKRQASCSKSIDDVSYKLFRNGKFRLKQLYKT